VQDEISLSSTEPSCVGKQFSDNVELVIAREDLNFLALACLFVLLLDDLSVIFENVGQATGGSWSETDIHDKSLSSGAGLSP
jgi:hypothetical protein